MLSIIISSYQPDYFSAIEKNIAETIGIPYEIIKIENPGKMGLCKAYNLGAEKAQYDFLLFLHEDVTFETKNWGIKLVKILETPNCGVIGVAGSDYYGYVPTSWWNKGYNKLHFIQADSNSSQKIVNLRANFSQNNTLEKVKALDGVFLACTKKIYLQFPFDENVDGYHGYDLVFSLKIAKHHQNYVSDRILLTHYSKGELNKNWLINILKVREIIGVFQNQKINQKLEKDNFDRLMILLKNLNFDRKESIKIILKYLNPRVIGLKNILKIINQLKYL